MSAMEPVSVRAGAPESRVGRLVGWHRAMVTSRVFEEFCMQLSGHWYAAVGEEATVVGTFSQLTSSDIAVPHYRGALIVPWLRGARLEDVLLTVIQRRTSPTRGRLYGAFAGNLAYDVFPFVTMVLGVNIAVANGIALALRRKQSGGVAVVSFGDGTAGTGEFHESLNVGALWKLPVVYVCQNNGYSISTPVSRGLAGDSLTGWASRYGMPAHRVDGNDVSAVAEAAGAAIARARAGAGPSFIEAVTYRRTGHFKAEPALYRPADELRRWEARDPIADLEARLRAEGILESGRIVAIWDEVRREVQAAAAAAEAEAPLTPADLGVDEVHEHADATQQPYEAHRDAR